MKLKQKQTSLGYGFAFALAEKSKLIRDIVVFLYFSREASEAPY
jgi:hypothetical protein